MVPSHFYVVYIKIFCQKILKEKLKKKQLKVALFETTFLLRANRHWCLTVFFVTTELQYPAGSSLAYDTRYNVIGFSLFYPPIRFENTVPSQNRPFAERGCQKIAPRQVRNYPRENPYIALYPFLLSTKYRLQPWRWVPVRVRPGKCLSDSTRTTEWRFCTEWRWWRSDPRSSAQHMKLTSKICVATGIASCELVKLLDYIVFFAGLWS